MSIVYRERERERERDRDRDRYDDPSSFASAQRSGNYTATKHYRVRDEDSFSTTFDGRRYTGNVRPKEPYGHVEETRVVRREREEPEPRPEATYSRWERASAPDSRWQDDIVIRRSKETEEPAPPPREYRRDEPPAERELVMTRTSDRDGYDRERDYPPERYEDRRRDYRDYEVVSPQRDKFGDVQRFSRTAEYYAPAAPPPQTIIIRNEPIVIREKVKDEDYAVIQRSEVEDRQVTRRAQSPAKKEDYFYEKTVEKRDARPPEKEREHDYYARKEVRDVSPGDSISQVGALGAAGAAGAAAGAVAGRRRSRSRGRSRHSDSDESLVYVRKEAKETRGGRAGSGSESPGHRRHLAEGALAGFGAAELLRHHKKSTGQETSGPVGRLGKDVGAGVLGAVAASGLSRAKHEVTEIRNERRSKSRRRGRSVSFEPDERRRGRSRSRSRSRSHSAARSHSHTRLKTLGGLGLAAAAAATAVAVAKKKKKDKEDSSERRSRSRHRRGSSGSSSASSVNDARNPTHRKKRIAEAGAAGAAVAGLFEGARSRSRKRKGERSRSAVRTGIPIAAAGLGSAAIAGIYERKKAQREMEAAAVEHRAQSRSRNRARSAYHQGARGSMSDPNLIEYGDGPMAGHIPQADYYGRGHPPADAYYPNAVVPAAAAAGGAAAGAHHGQRSHSRHRHHSGSESSDGGDDHRHRRRHSHSQSRDLATPALAALGGGLAATGYAKRKEKKDKARRRQEDAHGHDPYEDEYDPHPQRYTPTPPASADPYQHPHHQQGYYPGDERLPPPPGSAPAPLYPPSNQPLSQASPQQPQQPLPPQPVGAGYGPQQGPFPAQTGYNPASYSQPPANHPTYSSPQRPSPGVGYPSDASYPPGGHGDPRFPRGRGDEHVSAPPIGDNSPGEPRNLPPDADVSGAAVPPPRRRRRRRSRSKTRSSSQPAPASGSKNVAFDLGSGRSPGSSPDNSRQRRRQRGSGGETSGRGYEAEDDSESTLDGRDKRYPNHQPIEETESDPEKAARRSHRAPSRTHHERRHRNSDGGDVAGRSDDGARRHRRRSHRSHPRSMASGGVAGSDTPLSPASSDTTIELPDRFDQYGRKKPERGEDAVADFFVDMMSGKGPGGKYLHKFFGDHDGGEAGQKRRPTK